MSPTMIKAPYRFALDVPAFGLIGDVAVASTGRMWPAASMHYILVASTDVATVGMGKHLFSAPDRMTSASGPPVLDLNEFVLPTIDDFHRLRQDENITRKPTKEDRARQHIDTFLKEVYSLSKIGDTDTAGFKIFDFLDRVLLDGFFGVCNDILSTVNVDLLDTRLMRSFLSITAPAKKKLPARAALYKKIEAKMIALRGHEKTRKIIGTLA
jgi:hypothetical protein